MDVELICHTPEPEKMVAMSARLCYSPVGARELADRMSEREIASLVNKIVDMGHLSTLEHASFTFAVQGVSRTLTHQLVRHRVASYSQQSQRYVAEHNFEYILPPSIEQTAGARQVFTECMERTRTAYNQLVAMGVPREDARYCLTNAAETKIVITMNARELLHFFRLRCCLRAQWEIRAMAEMMLAKACAAAPLLFARAGPPCVTEGVCPEGEMTCGRLARLRR